MRFFRIAERRIADTTGRRIVCFISNYSWLTGPSIVVMRQTLLQEFDRFWIDNMHGDRKITEYGPDGKTSETVFAIRGFSPGIQQGTAIALRLRNELRGAGSRVFFNDGINASKADERRIQLLASLDGKDFDGQYTDADPEPANSYSFRSSDISTAYAS